MKKLIKNYTTDIPAPKTIAEIQALLGENGASGVMAEYENGIIKHIFFKIKVKEKEMPFRLPARPEQVYNALFKSLPGGWSKESRFYDGRWEKSVNIAWRICKTWLEAQITLINLQQAKMEEIFLPYLVMPGNKTLFEVMETNQFLLSGKSEG